MAKYTFRFHAHTWQDISVEANNAEDAFEIASDVYNNGEYEHEAENFENTDCEDITEYPAEMPWDYGRHFD